MGLQAEWGTCSRSVALNDMPVALACQSDIIAVGLVSGDTIILNAITGSQVAVLSGHTDWVRSLSFSLDGSLLVSGSDDQSAKLWDIQTGGVIKTYVHADDVLSVSISPDITTLASGCEDDSIYLWDVWTGECFCTIDGHDDRVNSVSFSPTNSQHLISASKDHTVQQWNTSGCKIGPTHKGKYVVFSLDGTHFVSWMGQVARVQDSQSGAVITKLKAPSDKFHCCCFSPSGELIAGGAGHTIYVWDITSSGSHLLKTFVGHTDDIIALTFPSSLISVSDDGSVKFWQIETSSADPVSTVIMPTPPTSVSIESVSLQARNGIVISSDSDGVVKTWDILTGHCKSSFQTPAKGKTHRDAQLIEGRLIFVWHAKEKIHIWDTEKNELLQTVNTPDADDLRISGDGSNIFCLTQESIQLWSMWTGEAVGAVEIKGDRHALDPLITDGSKIWAFSADSSTKGWDFGILNSFPSPLSNTFPDRPHLNFTYGSKWWGGIPSRVTHTVTGKAIFQLIGRYAEPSEVQWDGQYLVAGYMSGEVLVLDFNHMVPQ